MNTAPDLDAIHGLAPVIDALPGEQVPYAVASGEGLRYEIDNQLWTVIARASDTGGLFDAAFVLGPRGAGSGFHSLADHQRSYYVFAGLAQFWLPGESRILGVGDSVHVPPGTPVAYRMLGHQTKLLMWCAPGGALDALHTSGGAVDSRVYSADGKAGVVVTTGQVLVPGPALLQDLPMIAASDAWDDVLPDGVEGYFLRAHTGDNREWPDSMNSIGARGRNTGGRYFSVLTAGAKAPYIPQHFHRLHTENFFCLSGRVWLYANGTERLLTEGDFVHAPAGTVHSFAFDAHNTRMLGMLTSDVFEPFFDITGVATENAVYTEGLVDPGFLMSKLGDLADLDVQFVGPPPTRVQASDLR
ncbi:hypothetical protein GCM10007304_17150 [Rhodococcoides trifolii]|uniref:Cupin type-2 domain-containing protein n=1 Tax=Rhodococcoides trifolii TaxID=908250 RepID=A0A917CZG7_9NOCA|nr:quercetin 2,3-dioxygenase [Rhodococcus trifolii]GGG03620.1 hypothetical protein GCM10007304_17150 [Rhodococcus trifolii]